MLSMIGRSAFVFNWTYLVMCFPKLRLDRLLIFLHQDSEGNSFSHTLLVGLRLRMAIQFAMGGTNSILPILDGRKHKLTIEPD